MLIHSELEKSYICFVLPILGILDEEFVFDPAYIYANQSTYHAEAQFFLHTDSKILKPKTASRKNNQFTDFSS